MHGEVHVNRAIQQADLIIGVGLRFDDRVTGNLAAFARGAKVIHIELDPSEIGKNVPVDGRPGGRRAGDPARAARARSTPRDCEAWRAEIDELRPARGRRASRAASRPRASSAALDDASRRALHHRLRRGSAPDVGGQAVPLPAAQHPHHLRRARHHGLRGAGGDGRGARAARTSRSGPSRATAASR